MKHKLRREFLSIRNQLPDEAKAFRDKFLQNIELKPASKLASYYPVNSEANVAELNTALIEQGHELYLPCIEDDNLIFRRWYKDCEMLQTKIPEPKDTPIIKPEEIDLFIIPLVAFDADKNRLGYGGGYYDRALENNDSTKIGIAYQAQKAEKLPVEEHDIKLDMIITEANIYK